MTEDPFYITELLIRSATGKLTPKQEGVFAAWLEASPRNRQLQAEWEDRKNLRQEWEVFNEVDTDQTWAAMEALLERKKGTAPISVLRKSSPVKIVRLIVACVAAAVLLIFIMNRIFIPTRVNPAVAANGRSVRLPRQGATLQMAGSPVINLAEMAIGFLQKVGCVNISKTAADRVVLSVIPGCAESKDAAAARGGEDNRLVTPRGHWFRATLTEGTTVRLSPESVLRFPTDLGKGQRKVGLEQGEGYFDVAKATGKDHRPQAFVVEVARHHGGVNKVLTITSTGTRFSVRAYADEAVIRTSLDEGAIAVAADGVVIALHPGEAAVLDVNGRLRSEPVVAMDTTAWSKGLFAFREQPADVILEDLARWYDAVLVYKDRKPDGIYTVKGFRQDSLPVLLDDLRKMGAPFTYTIHFDTVFVSR